jgi:hypothetical protein
MHQIFLYISLHKTTTNIVVTCVNADNYKIHENLFGSLKNNSLNLSQITTHPCVY